MQTWIVYLIKEVATTGQLLSVCDFFKYLGIWLQSDLKFSKHIEETIKTATKVSNFLLWVIRRGRGMRPRSAMYLWNAICRPLLEFGCEVWAPVITDRQKASLNLVQMEFLKSLLSTPVGMSNVFIRLETGQERLEARWKKLVLGFIQRATRSQERLLWAVMEMVMVHRYRNQVTRTS